MPTRQGKEVMLNGSAGPTYGDMALLTISPVVGRVVRASDTSQVVSMAELTLD